MTPKDYILLPKEAKAIIMLGISEQLSRVGEFSYPYTFSQLQNDEAKVNLLDNIIVQMYGAQKNMDINKILNGFESASLSTDAQNI
jgi:hypothetical protein